MVHCSMGVSCYRYTLTVSEMETSKDLQQPGGTRDHRYKNHLLQRKRLYYNNVTAVSNDIPTTG